MATILPVLIVKVHQESIAIYGEALWLAPRERVPLDWAMTQNNLGSALWTLGARVSCGSL
jgi:hypothetical protein